MSVLQSEVEVTARCRTGPDSRLQETRNHSWLTAGWAARSAWLAWAFGVLVVGLLLFPIRVTGARFTDLPGDAVDNLFNMYVLEHGWQWLSGHQSRFWDAPFFYPEPNVIAYSDCHLGTLPLFAFFRWVGCDRETAFQGWYVGLFALNYLSCLCVLRRLGMKWHGAIAGAYVFAFGMPLVGQIGHSQLIGRFFVPIASYFALRVCKGGTTRDWFWLGISVVGQFYVSIYMGYFLMMFLTALVPIYTVLHWRAEIAGLLRQHGWSTVLVQLALLAGSLALLPDHRRWFLATVAAVAALGFRSYRDVYWRCLCGSSVGELVRRIAVVGVCLAAMFPLVSPYLELYRERGGRDSKEILSMLPRLQSWGNSPTASLCWSKSHLTHLDFLAGVPPWEHELFLGGVPAAALLVGLFCVLARRDHETALHKKGDSPPRHSQAKGDCPLFCAIPHETRCLAGACTLAVALIFLVTLQTDSFCLYTRLLTLPGVSAIRAVTRVALVLLFPAGVAVAFTLSSLDAWLRPRLGSAVASLAILVLVPLVIADQAVGSAALLHFSKHETQERAQSVAELVRRQNPNAKMFIYAWTIPSEADQDLAYKCMQQQIVAMGAAQILGIPTLNGYSGNAPVCWSLAPTFENWSQLEEWQSQVVDRVGEENLRKRVPYYSEHRFDGLVVVGSKSLSNTSQKFSRATSPLPEGGFHARLELPSPPSVVLAGSTSLLKLHVSNQGNATWPVMGLRDGKYRIGVAYRWLTIDGREISSFDNNRHYLDYDVLPSTCTALDVRLKAPREPGRYVVEFDMVQELVAWFSQKGSVPLRAEINVVPGP